MTRSKSIQRAETRLLAEWAPLGFSLPRDLSEEEQAVLDLSLKRANQWVHETPVVRSGDGTRLDGRVYRPYTSLLCYAPHMTGTRLHWAQTELQFEHASGRLYSKVTVEASASLFSAARVRVARVTDLGTDLQAAIAHMDQESTRTMEHLLTTVGPKARFAPYPFPESQLSSSVRDYEPSPFEANRELIRRRLADGLQEAEDRRELERAAAARLARLATAGYE